MSRPHFITDREPTAAIDVRYPTISLSSEMGGRCLDWHAARGRKVEEPVDAF